jgi:ABC-2 type transport system permease protein
VNGLRAFFERDVRLALAYPQGLVIPLVSIVFTVAGFAFLSHLIDPKAQLRYAGEPLDYFSYVVLNMAFMLLLNGALAAVAGAIRRDQVAGTLEAIAATPMSVGAMLVASSLWPVAFAAVEAAVYIATGTFFGLRVPAFSAAAFFAVLVPAIACMAAVGMFGAAAVVRFKANPPSSFLTGSAAAMLSGALFPVSLMPPALRDVSWLLPLTHALSGLRDALSAAPAGSLAGEILWLSAAAVLLLPPAVAVFSRTLQQAKRDGTLAGY